MTLEGTRLQGTRLQGTSCLNNSTVCSLSKKRVACNKRLTSSMTWRTRSPFLDPSFILALLGIRRLAVQIKAIERTISSPPLREDTTPLIAASAQRWTIEHTPSTTHPQPPCTCPVHRNPSSRPTHRLLKTHPQPHTLNLVRRTTDQERSVPQKNTDGARSDTKHRTVFQSKLLTVLRPEASEA